MSLRWRVLLIVGVTIVAFGAILYFAYRDVLLGGFARLEQHSVEGDIHRALGALDNEMLDMDTLAYNWAAWDDSYAFVQDRNQEYIKANLVDSTFTRLRLNLMLYVDTAGQVVFTRGFDLSTEKEAPISQGLEKYLAENGTLLRLPDEESHISGIIILPEGPVLIASRPILTSEGEGPMRGALLMGRYLNSVEVHRIAQKVSLSLSLYPLDDPQLLPDLQTARSSLVKEQDIFMQPLSSDVIAGYALINGTDGKPVVMLKVEEPRTIYAQGVSTTNYFLLSYLLIGMVVIGLMMFLLERMVLLRVSQLEATVSEIGKLDNPSARVPVDGNDELSSLSGSINSMLERIEKSRAALRDSEERYRLLANNANEAIVVVQDMVIVYANPKAARLSGYPLDQPLSLTRLVHPDDRELALQRHLQRIKGEKVPDVYTIRIVDIGGNVRWAEISAVFISWRGKPATLVFLNDVTERRQTEEALRRNEERFRVTAESTSDLIWEWNGKDGTLLWFGDIDGILGYQPGEFPRTLEAWEKVVHPADHDWVMEALQRGVDGVEPYNVKYRVARKDGSIRYWTDRGTATALDENGHALIMVGACNDVTARELAVEALQKSEERYRTVLEEMEDNYFEVDLAGHIIFANDATCRTLGYTSDELKGMNYRVFIAEEDVEPLYRSFNTVYQTGKMLKGVSYDIVRKDGSRGTGEFAVSPRRNEKGEIIGFRGVGRDITERKQAEETLRKTAYVLGTIIESTADGILVVDSQGAVLHSNSRFKEMWQIPDAVAASKDDQVLLDFVLDQLVDPGSFRAKVQMLYQTDLQDWDTLYFKDSRIFERFSCPLIQNGRIAGRLWSFRDITERKKAEEALRSSEQKYQNLVEGASVGIATANADGLITFANQTLYQALGYSEAEMKGKPVLDFVHPDDRKRMTKAFVAVVRDNQDRDDFEFRAIHKDGHVVYFQLGVTPLKDGDRTVGTISVLTDVTEHVRMEEDRKELEFKAQMASRLATVGEMAAGIAHEINNPLTGVIGYAQFMMQEDLPKTVKKDVELINEGAQRVAGIVKRLLAFARQTKPQRDFVNINDVINTTLNLRAYHLKTSNIKVTTKLDPDLPITVADGGQLQQVFLNLIINAEAEMRSAHVKGKMLIKTEKVEDNIMISFKDDGPGIAEENLEKIFNPFFTTRQVGQGTGLGLSICYGIVVEHGGKIWAESKPGKGAIFIVELPIVIEPEQLPLAETPVPEMPAVATARILVVDDEATVRDLLKRTLEEEGHEVECVDNAADALELVQKKRYSLILLDVKMPGMSGPELYQRMNKITKSLARRVVFVTGDVIGASTQEFLKKTKARYIAKPFEVEQMKKEINSILAEEA